MSHQQSEMIEICPTVWHGSKPLDPFVEFLGSIQGILLVQGTLVGLEVLDVFGQPGCDLLVVEELRENGELPPEELVGEIDGSVGYP